ncbi:MAG: hypothetical protein BM564_01775 [Bacteroidetes bacterium MedPE-SWsnd-G2]|nr:MAG: hypothetical protein BM564_01775 [Bacteroidetes bacterium MedPE-SWsnd-G2]
MNFKTSIGKNISALMLLIALMSPTAIEFAHAFEGHEHTSCTEQKDHIHDNSLKCELCSIHIPSVAYKINGFTELEPVTITVQTKVNLKSIRFHSFTITNTQLRAPPCFS